jgi:DNA-3-methyladenine glycosylase II
MFSLGRLDIFPINDQSIRSAMIRLYDLNKVNFKSRTSEISDEWRPYRTIASWYLYRYLDLDTTD